MMFFLLPRKYVLRRYWKCTSSISRYVENYFYPERKVTYLIFFYPKFGNLIMEGNNKRSTFIKESINIVKKHLLLLINSDVVNEI